MNFSTLTLLFFPFNIFSTSLIFQGEKKSKKYRKIEYIFLLLSLVPEPKGWALVPGLYCQFK